MSALASWMVSCSGIDAVSGTDIIIAIRCFYLLSAASILIVRYVPVLRDRFLEYGARSSIDTKTVSAAGSVKASIVAQNKFIEVLDYVASWQVSHSYFLLFYVVATGLSLFWMHIAYTTEAARDVNSEIPLYTLGCFTLHSLRRLYESLFVTVPNASSRMWIGHFAIGLMFYVFVHVAIIADFANEDGLLETNSTPARAIAGALFLASSTWQHLYHRYLAGLVKYTLPEHYGARWIVAPHYTAECLLYVCLAILAAPSNRFCNMTLLCVLVFVTVNLGVTAEGTKAWQRAKFRERRAEIERRWRMLPGMW